MTAKLKEAGDIYVLTWPIFTGQVTYMTNYTYTLISMHYVCTHMADFYRPGHIYDCLN